MNIDFGLAVVIAAVLIFYLRLIILQRQRAKRNLREQAREPARETARPASKKGAGKDKAKSASASPQPRRYSNLTQNSLNWAIAGCGALAILIGILLNAQILPFPTLQTYWWAPTALGIVAFSWIFEP